MSVEPSEFRRILGHWTSGVAIVTSATASGEPRGLTANAVASVSLEPPLVLVCVERIADTHDVIRAHGHFAINVLAQDDERTARRFAAGEPGDKFVGIAFRTEMSGCPVLESALAWVDCHVRAEIDGGDHTIFVGTVLSGDAREAEPLVYYRGGYNRLAP